MVPGRGECERANTNVIFHLKYFQIHSVCSRHIRVLHIYIYIYCIVLTHRCQTQLYSAHTVCDTNACIYECVCARASVYYIKIINGFVLYVSIFTRARVDDGRQEVKTGDPTCEIYLERGSSAVMEECGVSYIGILLESSRSPEIASPDSLYYYIIYYVRSSLFPRRSR